MIGLDTNVLVRYFAQDDEIQSKKATKLIESLSDAAPGFISMVTLIELVWVMQGAYKAKKDSIVQILTLLLQTKEFIVENAEIAWQALAIFRDSKSGFPDCLIERTGNKYGCEYTATFDLDAAATSGMRLLK
ncbi:MAG: type II toxin-antitoxin system VapC family toxin [Burkholderiales bacterium]|nr:type II toxin-antitoxin system VapC family toxin [Burkholderiales bacterium]